MIEIKNRWTGIAILSLDLDDLRGADLTGADLRDADLRGADLTRAVLRDADLTDAVLTRAVLRDAVLTRADLQPILEQMGIEQDKTLPARIIAQIETHPETWQQDTWHSFCGGRHSVAGWATTLSGALGKYMDRTLGTPAAATLLLWRPGAELPSFSAIATEAETLGRLRVMAAAAAAEESKP